MNQRRPFLTRLAAVAGVCALGAAFTAPAYAGGEDEDGEETPVEEGADPQDSDDPNTLVVATGQSVENWNPFLQIYVIEHQFRQLNYEPLVRLSAEDYTPVPGLAEDWDVSEDGLTWTFYLHEDLTWQDGEPFTAEDVEYTYYIRAEDPVVAARNTDSNELLESVTAVDDYTVEFVLTEPDVGLEASDQVIVPKHIWEEYEGAWNEFANDDFPIVGIGPYQVTDFETDTFIRFERFDDYWRGEAGFDEIVFQYYTEPDTAVAALETGEIDLVGALNEQQYQRLEGQDNIAVNSAPDRRWLALRFNTGSVTRDGEEFGDPHPALGDAQVRQAIHHAIDRESLIERVRGGYASPGTSIVPNVFETIWWEPSDDERVEFDADEAGRLLDEAGYTMGDNGVRVGPDGEPLTLRFGVDAGNAERETTALFIEEWLEDVGINVEQTISEDISAMFDDGELDMTFTGWGIQPNPVYNFNRNSCSQLPTEPGGGTTDTFYCNEDLDAIVDATQRELDEDARADMYREAQAIMYDEAPMIFLWYPYVMEAYRTDKVAEFTTQPSSEGMIMGQTGSWAYFEAVPTGEAGGGTSTGVLIGVGAVVVAGAAIVGFVLLRRNKTADDRE